MALAVEEELRGRAEPPLPPHHGPKSASNLLFAILDLCWRSPESDDVWYKSRQWEKTICLCYRRRNSRTGSDISTAVLLVRDPGTYTCTKITYTYRKRIRKLRIRIGNVHEDCVYVVYSCLHIRCILARTPLPPHHGPQP